MRFFSFNSLSASVTVFDTLAAWVAHISDTMVERGWLINMPRFYEQICLFGLIFLKIKIFSHYKGGLETPASVNICDICIILMCYGVTESRSFYRYARQIAAKRMLEKKFIVLLSNMHKLYSRLLSVKQVLSAYVEVLFRLTYFNSQQLVVGKRRLNYELQLGLNLPSLVH